ncbi:hypothetical protein Vi05172_g1402 [Venturia inaequalis]|nr:hypothetical protein Vi05172_g1402 [Venturia inaequalis]
MNTAPPQPGTQHLQNFTVLAPLLGIDIRMTSQYITWPAPTQIAILRGSLMYKIGQHTINGHVSDRINTTLVNLSAAELLELLSDSTAFEARIVALRDQYRIEARHLPQIPRTTNRQTFSPEDEPSQLSDEDDFASEGHSQTPELRNGQSPLARANRFFFDLGSVAVGGLGEILRTASGTALGLGQTALGAVSNTGGNALMSPVHRSQSERVLGSPRLGHAGAGEEWEMMGAWELELNAQFEEDRVAGRQFGREDGEEERNRTTQRTYEPSRPGLEDDIANAMNGQI